jgi:trehalose 6-phosphate synthase
MNLVAKEYVAAQDEDDPGVLVLSEFAGAAADLKASLLVNPNDPESVATAIHRALMMPKDERKSRHRDLLSAVQRTDISHWGERFISLLRKPDRRRSDAWATEAGSLALRATGLAALDSGQPGFSPLA